MKIVLKQDHEKNGIRYLEGEEIEVTKEEYDFIMSCYLAQRKQLRQELEQLELNIENKVKGKK